MREILFRGQRTDNGEWAEGYYYCFNSRHFIHVIEPRTGGASLTCYEVKSATVGEYTGFNDSKEIKIFENDVLKFAFDGLYYKSKVVFQAGSFTVQAYEDYILRLSVIIDGMEVIGNTHGITP